MIACLFIQVLDPPDGRLHNLRQHLAQAFRLRYWGTPPACRRNYGTSSLGRLGFVRYDRTYVRDRKKKSENAKGKY